MAASAAAYLSASAAFVIPVSNADALITTSASRASAEGHRAEQDFDDDIMMMALPSSELASPGVGVGSRSLLCARFFIFR